MVNKQICVRAGTHATHTVHMPTRVQKRVTYKKVKGTKNPSFLPDRLHATRHQREDQLLSIVAISLRLHRCRPSIAAVNGVCSHLPAAPVRWQLNSAAKFSHQIPRVVMNHRRSTSRGAAGKVVALLAAPSLMLSCSQLRAKGNKKATHSRF